MNVNDKIYLKGEKKPYVVRSLGNRFAVCTKPFNLKKTVIYTILDLENNVRGTENLIFCMGFETTEDCNEALKRLESGETEISRRNIVPLVYA
jgi:hypothetical protein